ncbi:adenosine kinase [Psychrobacter lutiphocae]|uniref:adenosine kinase n=1 Tax=Psychrobacter lutiphocae TaxID=540500 RepID=UPI000361072E|nr:adenosine kinase [Psychrobacter lutiphocae]
MYDVMAIGNALVDHEYQLNDEQLIKTSLAKGTMTLASFDEQTQLLNEFKAQQIQPSKQSGGGSAANAMYAFSCLGGKSFYGCRVGDDEAGKFYLNDLNQAGVATSDQLSITHDGVTGSCVVAITPDGERTMQTYLGTSSDIQQANIDLDALSQSDWLYFEGYLAMSEALRPDLQKIRKQAIDNNTKIAVSFADPAVVNFGKEGLVEMLGEGVDTIFCNVDEAKLFTDAKDIKQAAQVLTNYCQLAVVTSGPDDTVICQRDKDGARHLTIVSPPTVDNAIDTNGAGDNYSGAFLYALTQGYSLQQCAQLAGHVASRIVQQFGPRLTSEQYQQIAQQILG